MADQRTKSFFYNTESSKAGRAALYGSKPNSETRAQAFGIGFPLNEYDPTANEYDRESTQVCAAWIRTAQTLRYEQGEGAPDIPAFLAIKFLGDTPKVAKEIARSLGRNCLLHGDRNGDFCKPKFTPNADPTRGFVTGAILTRRDLKILDELRALLTKADPRDAATILARLIATKGGNAPGTEAHDTAAQFGREIATDFYNTHTQKKG